jgi:inhibitor of KinA sporulation pathway (predicted exonuclease)
MSEMREPISREQLIHDQIVVVDLEATCWDKSSGGVPDGQRSEIIEIGVALVDAVTFEPSQPMSFLVKPTMSKVGTFCTELTTITQKLVDTVGLAFADAGERLESRYNTPHRLWGSWGNYDIRLFKEQCELMGVRYPFSDYHFNIKKFFTERDNKKKSMGMAAALVKLEIPLEGTHHRGGDDAWNIAKILQILLQRHGTGFLKKYW